MRTTTRVSTNQSRYLSFIAAHPGCSIADVDRACRRNPRAGHKWVYDGVNRLIDRGLVQRSYAAGRTVLSIPE